MTIPVVPIEEQNLIMQKVEKLEEKINEEISKMQGLMSKRRDIVNSYLT